MARSTKVMLMRCVRHGCAFLFALLVATPASAIPRLPKTLYVGVGSNDCDYATIQAAVDASINGDLISVTPTQSYTGQHVTLNNRSIGITGGSTCGLVVIGKAAASIPARLPIIGDGVNPVFSISGGSVTLSNLEISGGLGPSNSLIGAGGVGFLASGGTLALHNVDLHDNTGGYGAGVAIYGDGALTLDGAHVHDNHATGQGGGISAVTSFIGHLEVRFVDDAEQPSEVAFNSANANGGGIYASGDTHLVVVASAPGRISIHDNSVGDPVHNVVADGGGIEFDGGEADIALPGATGLYANHAAFGAGISLGATNQASAVLRLFSTDPQFPTDIESNVATAYGGALYVGGSSGPTYAKACLFDVALSGNSAAQRGGAIAVGDGGRLAINPPGDADCDRAAIAALGAQACDPAVAACNAVRQNSAPDSGVIAYAGAATLAVERVRLGGNDAGSAIQGVAAAGSSVTFRDCVIDHNTLSGALVALDGAGATFDGCTFADDAIGAATVFVQNAGLALTRSIVAEAKPVYDPNVAGFAAQYALFNDPKLPTDASVVYASPAFVDAPGGDYRLQAASPAIDVAPTGNEGSGGDFDRQPREVDLAARTNLFGARDLGAFEYQVGNTADRIFLGTFD
jgi:predicted outer membrane repeat protein